MRRATEGIDGALAGPQLNDSTPHRRRIDPRADNSDIARNKTVFISSTSEDLEGHRREVWRVLEGFNVEVRGMERFGARPEAPLDTCLAEVESSDIYVGIVAFRLGSIVENFGKSFTQLEYERAYQLDKKILICLADERVACFPYQRRVDEFLAIMGTREPVQVYARLEFTPEDVREVRGEFFRYEFIYATDEVADDHPEVGYKNPEGKVILLFSKSTA